MNSIKSFFFGLRDSTESKLMFNDWKLRLYVRDRFPEVPRFVLGPEDTFEDGDIVECRQQKSDWSRARVVKVRVNRLVDLKYDSGEEIRFVDVGLVRLPPDKNQYAYRVEFCMAMLVLLLPLATLAALIITPALLFLTLFGVSGLLLVLRIFAMMALFRKFPAAGCCAISKLAVFFAFPLIVLFVASLIGLSASKVILCCMITRSKFLVV